MDDRPNNRHEVLTRALKWAALIGALSAWTAGVFGFATRIQDVGDAPEKNARAIENLRAALDARRDVQRYRDSVQDLRHERMEQWTCDVNNVLTRFCEDWIEERMPLNEIRR